MDGLMSVDKEALQSLYTEIGRLKTIVEGIENLSRQRPQPDGQKKHLLHATFSRNIKEVQNDLYGKRHHA